MLIGVCRYAVILLLLTAISSGQVLKVGEPAPPMTLDRTIPTGMDVTWDALRGKPVVIEFWGTWCGNCVTEIPHLNELVSKFPGVQFISITDEQLSTVGPFLTKRPILGWVGLDCGESTFKAYGVEARPQTMLVDRTGILRGIMHPRQVIDAVVSDLIAGRPVSAQGLSAPLHIFENQTTEPVFAVVLRPSGKAKPGGVLGVDAGQLQGDNLTLKTIIAYAYSMNQSRLVGPEDILGTRYDFCILLPQGMTGDVALLRDMLERTFKLKVRRETREVDALVLKAVDAKLQQSPSSPRTMRSLVGVLESRLKRLVVDETGLGGRYDFEYPPDNDVVEKYLREQLGLELSQRKRAIEFLAIDSLELPSFRVSLPGR